MNLTILMRNIIFVMLFLNISSASCKEREVVEIHKKLYSQKVIPCYLDYGIDFCDARHLTAIKKAIKTKKPDFYKKFIILFIKEFKSRLSMVAIDSITHIAYPLPFDFFGGSVDEKGFNIGAPSVGYNLTENKICIVGRFIHIGMLKRMLFPAMYLMVQVLTMFMIIKSVNDVLMFNIAMKSRDERNKKT